MATTTRPAQPCTLRLEDVGLEDVALVGGKAASLGELGRALRGTGAIVPTGFAVTTHAYERLDAHTFRYRLPIVANGEIEVRYTARVRWC